MQLFCSPFFFGKNLSCNERQSDRKWHKQTKTPMFNHTLLANKKLEKQNNFLFSLIVFIVLVTFSSLMGWNGKRREYELLTSIEGKKKVIISIGILFGSCGLSWIRQEIKSKIRLQWFFINDKDKNHFFLVQSSCTRWQSYFEHTITCSGSGDSCLFPIESQLRSLYICFFRHKSTCIVCALAIAAG